MDRSKGLLIDAVPQQLPVTFIENESSEVRIENLLSDFNSDDYKSAFFLLMDYIELEEFLFLTKQKESYIKDFFINLYNRHLNSKLLVELFGTLKMYKKLRMLGKCSHVYESESEEQKFNGIDGFWKTLYALCEELTDDELNILKENVESDFRGQILSTEDWFCWALQQKLFSKTNLFNLEQMFRNYPKCLNIIKSYKGFGLYDVRLPTDGNDCGIALIFHYDKFNENSKLAFREYSYKDVDSLKCLWKTYGFKVDVHENLTHLETYEKMKEYGSKNYNYDVFVCCILSHGQSNAAYSSDGKLMEITDFVAPVANCSSLKNKPKLFFIQACQGPNIPGVAKPVCQVAVDKNTPVIKLTSQPPVLCDTLLVNSSIDGFVSFRDKKGSWFIQTLCKRMMENGENSSIDEIMTEVNEEVRNYSLGSLNGIQIVNRSSTLGKKLILKKRV